MQTTARLNPDTSFNRAAIMRNAWALAKANTSGTDDIRRLPLIKRLAVFLRWEWTAAKQERTAQHAWRPHYRAEVARIGREAAESFCRATLDYDRMTTGGRFWRPSAADAALAMRLRAILSEGRVAH
jgi:hypothetical protein